MKKDNFNTRHSEIFDYWKDKDITPEGNVVLSSENVKNAIPVIYDWGEPMCCACGKTDCKIFDKKRYENDLENNIGAIWNYSESKSLLNRCHIKPRSIGGSDNPFNLFLLCEECHIEAPDTTNPQNFLSWVYEKRMAEKSINGFYIGKIANDFIRLCGIRNKNPKTVNLECAGKNIFSHSGKVSQSSVVYAMVDSCENK